MTVQDPKPTETVTFKTKEQDRDTRS